MARSRHKPNKRGRQPGQRPPGKPADPIVNAAALAGVDAGKANPIGHGFVAAQESDGACYERIPPGGNTLAPGAGEHGERAGLGEAAAIEGDGAPGASSPFTSRDGTPPPTLQVTPRTARGMSLLALSQVLGVGRSVVEGWVQRHGCPAIRDSNGKGTGNEWSFDLAAVVAWRIEHERRITIAEMGADAIEPKDRLILLKIAKEANLVVPVAYVEATYERANGKARQAIMSASTRLARSMDGFPADRVSQWALQADEILRDVLKTWQEDASSIDLTPSDHVMVLDDADAPPP